MNIPEVLRCSKAKPDRTPDFLRDDLLLILLGLLAVTASGSSGLLAANTAGTAATEGRGQSEVNVLLGVQADHVGRNVDDLLADTDVTLLDEDTSVVDGLGEAELVDAGLETTLKEILNLKGKDVIELHAGLVEDTDAHKTANQGVTLEQTLGVLLIESEELTVRALVSCCIQ
jgi:nitrous oxidase accessory protein NosD